MKAEEVGLKEEEEELLEADLTDELKARFAEEELTETQSAESSPSFSLGRRREERLVPVAVAATAIAVVCAAVVEDAAVRVADAAVGVAATDSIAVEEAANESGAGGGGGGGGSSRREPRCIFTSRQRR